MVAESAVVGILTDASHHYEGVVCAMIECLVFKRFSTLGNIRTGRSDYRNW